MQISPRSRSHLAGSLAVVIFSISGCSSTTPPPLAVTQFDARKEINLTEQKAPIAADAGAPRPDPKHSPEQVVGFVLEALRLNDTPDKDSGIRTTFGFASPGNREVTGPIERFIELVKNPLYKPLLNHRRAERTPIRTAGDAAQQRVTLIGADGRRATYLFTLSKQAAAPYQDCWMTDGVERLSDDDPDKDKQIAQSNGHLLSQ